MCTGFDEMPEAHFWGINPGARGFGINKNSFLVTLFFSDTY
jgi:hypothetical protein